MIDGVEEAMGELISSLTMISKILNRPTVSPLRINQTGLIPRVPSDRFFTRAFHKSW